MKYVIAHAVLIAVAVTQFTGCAGVVVGAAATGVAVSRDRRTTGTVVEDQSIELKAGVQLRDDVELREQTHINVTSYNNSVLLTGEAPTETLRARAGEIVRGIDKVRQVYNEIIIAAPSALASRSSDSFITAKVKTSLFNISDFEHFDPTRVKVVTENGTVFLMGLLTREQGDAVADTVRQVSGVERVVKIFEYRGG